MLLIAATTAMAMPSEGFFRAEVKVASPFGKLCIAIANALMSPFASASLFLPILQCLNQLNFPFESENRSLNLKSFILKISNGGHTVQVQRHPAGRVQQAGPNKRS